MDIDVSVIDNKPVIEEPVTNDSSRINPNLAEDGSPNENKMPEVSNGNDDVMKIARLKLTIEILIQEFPIRLASFKNVKTDNLSITELEETIKNMKFIMNCRSSITTGSTAILSLIKSCEDLLTYSTGMDFMGLSKSIENDKDSIEDVKAVVAKYVDVSYTAPELRLIFTIFNKMYLKQSAMYSKPPIIINDVNQRYTDI